MRILAFHGSPRSTGNSRMLLDAFVEGAREEGAEVEVIAAHDIDLRPCRGCLKCNLVERCRIRGDDWEDLAPRILAADALVFAAPVYFRHLPGPLKCVVDRFRSFLEVKITEEGLEHRPWVEWGKDFAVLLTMGSSSDVEARPLIEFFGFLDELLGGSNRLKALSATRLAAPGQVALPEADLAKLYAKLGLPPRLAAEDARRNREWLDRCRAWGRDLGRPG